MFKRARNILFTLPLSLFFALLSSSNALSENEVWRVHLTGDINPSTRDSSPQHLTVVEDSLYFAANNNELWITDGSTANTRLVTDFSKISPGAYIGDETAAFNGTFYFSAYTPESGHGLWRSDGTESGTWLVKDVNQGKTLTASEHLLYFVANGGELWATDGSTNGTYLVKDVGQQNFNIINMIDVKGTSFSPLAALPMAPSYGKAMARKMAQS